jgi:hypothetical protein
MPVFLPLLLDITICCIEKNRWYDKPYLPCRGGETQTNNAPMPQQACMGVHHKEKYTTMTFLYDE